MKQGKPESPERDLAYVLHPAGLEPGDILLSTDFSSFDSFVIRTLTGGPYSHAAICTRPGILTEATTLGGGLAGVQRCSVRRIAVSEPGHVRVLRLRPALAGRKAFAEKAAHRAEWMISREYWLEGAFKFLLRRVPENGRQAFFCSHLVAEAYQHAKCALLPGLPPEKISPNALLASELVEDVTQDILVPVHLPTLQAHMVKSDEGPMQTVENPIAQRVLRDERVVRILAEHGYQAQPGLWDLYVVLAREKDPRLDAILAAAVREVAEGYRAYFRTHAAEEADLDALRQELADGRLASQAIRTELTVSRHDKIAVDGDVADREKDVADNEQIWLKTRLATFYERWRFSQEYLDLMRRQKGLLEARIALLCGHVAFE